MNKIERFCAALRNAEFGGSAEEVDLAIQALNEQLTAETFETHTQFYHRAVVFLDQILDACGSVLPMINLYIRANRALEKIPETYGPEQAKKSFLDYLNDYSAKQATALKTIGAIGARMAPVDGKISTFSTSGTVEEIYRQAVASGKKLSAAVFEARPNCEGRRTFETLSAMGVETILGVDALLARLIPGSDFFVIGVDAVRPAGEVYAKSGSLLAAMVCKAHGIPFYVAADTSKFDPMSALGYPMKDSSRPAKEVYDKPLPENGKVVNASFELIQPEYVSGIITEAGLVAPTAFAAVAGCEALSERIQEKLAEWLQRSRF